MQTNEQERFHGILETISSNGDVALTASHRLDNTNPDIMALSTSLIDLFDTIDSSVQSFELQKRVIQSSNIVEIIAIDVDLSAGGKCKLNISAWKARLCTAVFRYAGRSPQSYSTRGWTFQSYSALLRCRRERSEHIGGSWAWWWWKSKGMKEDLSWRKIVRSLSGWIWSRRYVPY